MKKGTLWGISVAVSGLLIILLVFLWVQMDEYQVKPTQLVNEQATNEYLNKNWGNESSGFGFKIKTGVFIQSLQFFNSSEVNLTGYIWQHYKDGLHDEIKPGKSEVGFILPEQVNSGSDIEPREIYRNKNGDVEVIGWYFEATLRQPFEYSKYPFDNKTVWIRIWPKKFGKHIILVPDFDAYKATGLSDTFGIEQDIVLGTWERKETYFDYKTYSYDTNFGIPGYIGQADPPELHYNFVVKRKFENAFIVYLLPLFLVAALLFAALLTVTGNDKLTEKFGFSTSSFIGSSSALFFVVMLAHIQLRQQFAGASIVYIEYFYLLMYALLVAATVNTYLFSINSTILGNVISYEDNIIPKVAYWPFLLTCLVVITWLVM